MHSICMDGAKPGAVGNARQLRAALETAGWRLVGPPEVMIVLLASLNDLPIMMIAYDNVLAAPTPVRWDPHRVLTVASVLGNLGLMASFLLLWFADDYLKLPRETTQSINFLKLLIAGHLTIYVARNPSWF